MRISKTLLLLLLGAALSGAQDFSGVRAFEHVRHAVDFGPRPSGSPAIQQLQAYILAQLKNCRCEVIQDDFTAATPKGPVAMKNIIVRFRASGRNNAAPAVAVTGHYDTKIMPGFVGANDGGSSTGVLLELAHVLSARRPAVDIYLVFFDGEEAVAEWSDTDGTYGSRHLAQRWAAENFLPRLRALINVDMIGDRNLNVPMDQNSDPALNQLSRTVAEQLGLARQFPREVIAIEDDHLPFAARGVKVLDLIDFDYGPLNSYWHTPQDTIDKLAPESLEATGKVVLGILEKLR